MFKYVQTRTQLLITHIFDASRKTSMLINFIAARRQAHWTKLYADGLFSVRPNNIRANDVSGKRRSAEGRFGKMTFGWTTIRKRVVRHYEVSLIRRFGQMTFGKITIQQSWISAKRWFDEMTFQENHVAPFFNTEAQTHRYYKSKNDLDENASILKVLSSILFDESTILCTTIFL